MFNLRFSTVMTLVSRIRHAAVLRTTAGVLVLLSGVTLLGGCRLCADCDLDSYAAYGGAWQRTHRDTGRVGSIFDPGGNRMADLAERTAASDHDARHRAALQAQGESEEEEESSENGDRTRDIPGDLELDDEDMREMQQRYRELDLQDIYYRGNQEDPADWQ